ncbi:MAG: hypothetical protein CENE_00378 [Candidatus Celerinatantimonas neptuna]|nr:MAG: hypothetical protein CENE_00378 [Candidatus Celerinatantimonas neptuna]
MVEELLDHQHYLLEQLLALLAREYQCLSKRELDSIISIAKQKMQLLKQLTENDELIAEHPQKQAIKQKKKLIHKQARLESLLQKCHHANEINGRIIEASSEEVERLAHEMNQLLRQQSMTYDKAGRQNTAVHHGKSFKV